MARTLPFVFGSIAIGFWGLPAYPCGGPWDVACNIGQTVEKGVNDTVDTGRKAVDDTVGTAKKAIDDSVKTTDKAANDVANTAKKALDDIANTGKKAVNDTAGAARKALSDVAWNYQKSANDLILAGKAIGNYVRRTSEGYGEAVNDAEKRLREGKVVDAIWHVAIDPYKHQEEAAAKATQESDIIKTAGQVAATAYGGPGGAAAYAAWYTYRKTGNADLAIRAGIITGAASAAFSAAGELPTDTIGQIAAKTIVTGAIGGAAVAAAGGDEAAVRDGFLLSGGMVLVQVGYQRTTTHQLDARASEGEPYCMATVGASCSPETSAYERDDQGRILLDEDGSPKVDVTKTDPRRPHVGKWAKADEKPLVGAGEQSGTMVAVSKIPGMNAMSVFHDQWAVSWDMDAFTTVMSIPPAIVLTYIGTGSPYYERLMEIAALEKRIKQGAQSTSAPGNKPLPVSQSTGSASVFPPMKGKWVAVQDVGSSQLFFEHVLPKKKQTVDAGDFVKAKKSINIRVTPADWTHVLGVLPKGRVVAVAETRTLSAPSGDSQIWARIDEVE